MKNLVIILMITGLLLSNTVIANDIDVNQDGQTGIPEAIYSLKVAAGMSESVPSNRHSLDAADGDPKDALYVDNDGKIIIKNKLEIKRYDVTLTNTEIDLGKQLQDLLRKYQNIRVQLPENSTWTWNQTISVYEDHTLQIWGTGTTDVNTISVTINMTEQKYRVVGGIENRYPARAQVFKNGHLYIRLVHVVETINDDRPINREKHTALFSTYDDGARIDFLFSKAWTTENLCCFGGGRGFGRISFGHTYHYMNDSCTVRDTVYSVSTDNGWDFDSQGGIVSNHLITQGKAVEFQRDPKIKYLYGGVISELPGDGAYVDAPLHIQGNILSEGDICIGKCD
jgi:hypothetical protein